MDTKRNMVAQTAVIDATAIIASQNKIDHFTVIEGAVKIGAENTIAPGCIIRGDRTKIGDKNALLAGVKIGYGPKDIGDPFYRGGIEIGNGNFFGEGTIINCGEADKFRGDITKIGNRLFCMGMVSIAHNSQIGFSEHLEPAEGVDYDTIISTGSRLAGFTTVKLGANLGLNTICHQFSWIGEGAMVGAGTTIVRDVPPFAKVVKSRICGFNQRTLQRYCGMSSSEDFAVIGQVMKLIAGLPAAPKPLSDDATEVEKATYAKLSDKLAEVQGLILDAKAGSQSEPLLKALLVINSFIMSPRNGRSIMKYKE